MSHYPFELKPLPYAYDALEPYIDAMTMRLHHDRHLRTYVDNLNAALKNSPEYQKWDLERLLSQVNWLPESLRTAVRNNGGGVYNHEFFFGNISPEQGTQPDGELAGAIEQAFGGLSGFAAAFSKAAMGVFGSGYAWLARGPGSGKNLSVVTSANQDTLITRGLCPVACIDVWEHAYYLKHYNKRADYIQDWFNVVNWDAASVRFNTCAA